MVCKFYDGGIIKVGTTAAGRFTMKVPSDEESWFATRLRAELIKRELATAAELPTDEAGEAAMATKAEAVAKDAAARAAWKQARADHNASPRRRATANLEAAQEEERIAGMQQKIAEKKRQIAEIEVEQRHLDKKQDNVRAKVEKVKALAKQLPQAQASKLDAWLARGAELNVPGCVNDS